MKDNYFTEKNFVDRNIDRVFSVAELEEMATQIQKLHLEEIKALSDYRGESDKDFKNSFKEDAYLANLKKIKLAQLFKPEQYERYELDRPCNCTREELDIPEWECYNT